MRFTLLHPREQLVNTIERIYNGGMTTLSGGNLSIKEDNGDVWITPAGVDKGKLAPQDIMLVRGDGRVVGPHKPSSELPFHLAIYTARPDLRAIVHAHPPALVSFSIARKIPDTNIIPQAQRICGMVGYAPYALPGSEKLGENIAAVFSAGYNVILLENHGIVTGGRDLLEAFQRLETLDFCARTLMKARGLGEVSTLIEAQLLPFDSRHNEWPEFVPNFHSSRERALRRQLTEFDTKTIPESYINRHGRLPPNACSTNTKRQRINHWQRYSPGIRPPGSSRIQRTRPNRYRYHRSPRPHRWPRHS
jgi:L-fuculose-phosphate aldolase